MKKIVAVLLCAALLATCVMALAESNSAAPADYAEEIWYTMAETGHANKNVMWSMLGMYSFGEKTGGPEGYVTLNSTEDGKAVQGGISWRIYPKNEEDVAEYFYSMMETLLAMVATPEDAANITVWLNASKAPVLAAFQQQEQWVSGIFVFDNVSLQLQYDPEHNELYTLLEAIKDTEHFRLKAK